MERRVRRRMVGECIFLVKRGGMGKEGGDLGKSGRSVDLFFFLGAKVANFFFPSLLLKRVVRF